MSRDYYREWSYSNRCEAFHDGDRKGAEQWDSDSNSASAVHDNWRNGGDFSDPDPEGRFH